MPIDPQLLWLKPPRDFVGIGTLHLSDIAKKYVNQALDTNRLSYGPFTRKFENLFGQLHQRKYAMFCNSGTSALQVGLHALKKKYHWKDGDEVLVPAVTFIASSNVILQNNLKPVFVDVEPDYFEIDPQKIESKITNRTRAIMPVHLFGHPAEMDQILKIANHRKLAIIEDSCEAMFAKFKGQPVGSWGEISCFSTYIAHLVATGVGGLATTNDPDLAVKIKSLFNHGRDGIYLSIDDDDTSDYSLLFKIVPRRFSFVDVGYSYRATELEAAIGLANLENWEKDITARKLNAQYLSAGLKDLDEQLLLPQIRPGAEHVFMFYPLVIKNKRIDRELLIQHLEINRIETRYMMPLINQPIYRELFGNIEDDYPVAKMINQYGFLLGCHPDLTSRDLDYIIFQLHEFFKGQSFEKVW